MKVLSKQEMQARIDDLRAKGYVYVYGAKYTGHPITLAEVKQLRNDNSQMYTEKYYADTVSMCVGKYAIDCSGLVCRIWGISEHGSWAISEFDESDGFKNIPYTANTTLQFGDCLWKSGHVGFALDNSTVYEAKGLYYGVVNSSRGATAWKKVIRPLSIESWDYEALGWIHDPDGSWWYATGHTRGDYYKNTVANIAAKQYMFDADGWLVQNPSIKVDASGAIKSISGTKYKS